MVEPAICNSLRYRNWTPYQTSAWTCSPRSRRGEINLVIGNRDTEFLQAGYAGAGQVDHG